MDLQALNAAIERAHTHRQSPDGKREYVSSATHEDQRLFESGMFNYDLDEQVRLDCSSALNRCKNIPIESLTRAIGEWSQYSWVAERAIQLLHYCSWTDCLSIRPLLLEILEQSNDRGPNGYDCETSNVRSSVLYHLWDLSRKAATPPEDVLSIKQVLLQDLTSLPPSLSATMLYREMYKVLVHHGLIVRVTTPGTKPQTVNEYTLPSDPGGVVAWLRDELKARPQ